MTRQHAAILDELWSIFYHNDRLTHLGRILVAMLRVAMLRERAEK